MNVEVPGDEVAPHLLHRVLLLLRVHQVNVRRKPETGFSKNIFPRFYPGIRLSDIVWTKQSGIRFATWNNRDAFGNNNYKENHFDFHVCLLFPPPKTSRACRDQGTEFLGGEAQNQPIGSTCHHCLFIMSCYVFTYVL